MLAGLLLALCIVCRLAVSGRYTLYFPLYGENRTELKAEEVCLIQDRPDVLHTDAAGIRDGWLQVSVYGDRAGTVFLQAADPKGNILGGTQLSVGPLRTVFDMGSGGFTGDRVVLAALTLFFLTVSAIMVWNFLQAKGPAFYSYTSIYFAGFSLFALTSGAELLRVTAAHLGHPAEYSMSTVYSTINGASMQFLILSSPLLLLFALAMGISNLALLRHEQTRLQNVLGFAVSLLLTAGTALGWFLFTRNFSGSEWEYRVSNTLQNTYATVFVYFECMLAGSALCAVKAARHRPEPDKDCILILGCAFRKDGTLPPLLRGRVDRAVEFWRHQKEATGKEAVLIPSGGRGPDETMAEAEAMRNYLLEQGIPDRLIRPETESANTYQNMLFSRRIVEETGPQSKAVFSTTNYHVFRSGVWASEAGLAAEGIGSRTRWWFWPNAFMRECIGLLAKRWKQEVFFLAVLAAYFAGLSMFLY